ncbi:Hypothetical protein CINCED_3A025955 [Cinara cedri]|uniref:Uncharacterized protein n=1 Tax=Cinara cedri TaxID=506608 RepID=A0A5E4MV08_9HEMI|nr:Hypothetical protein CINCED_3A025955 [Cinara cedri]
MVNAQERPMKQQNVMKRKWRRRVARNQNTNNGSKGNIKEVYATSPKKATSFASGPFSQIGLVPFSSFKLIGHRAYPDVDKSNSVVGDPTVQQHLNSQCELMDIFINKVMNNFEIDPVYGLSSR